MMPDACYEVADRLAYADMHAELVDWGLCWLRGGKDDLAGVRETIVEIEPFAQKYRRVIEKYAELDPHRKPRRWSKPEIEKAGRLHSRVIRMPLAHRLVLQVFYAETIAVSFHELEPDDQQQIIRDLTGWRTRPYGVNKRIEAYNRECGQNERPIHWTDFMPIRDRGVRMLANGESTMPCGQLATDDKPLWMRLLQHPCG